ncbi:MAG: AAA family ATPase [Myxococcales bacterium]|nr:AAA family ATPase [Myxococcales bacterium]
MLDAVNGVLRGKEDVVLDALTAILAGGHILLEDVPGVGKTTLGHALARVLGCSFRRIQFTSDLLPSDILGVNVFVRDTERFEFRPGPIFANVVLADEINRTTPKTQSSLLEAMNEGQVSIDDETRPLPDPFIVIATQNPQDFHGTYPLPESQLDRFMMRLHMGYPTPQVERAILRGRTRRDPLADTSAVATADQVRDLQHQVDEVRVDDLVLDYVMALVEASRTTPAIELGVSTRGALALQRAARARALLAGRKYTLPDDVKHLAVPVLAHRVQVAGGTEGFLRVQGEAERVIAQLVEQVPVPI